MSRFRFPKRAYGPFTETNYLPYGMIGVRTRGLNGSGVYYDTTSGSNPQNRINVVRSGVRRVKPKPLTPSVFTLDRYNSSCSGYLWRTSASNYWTETSGALHQVYALDPVEFSSNAALQSAAEIAALLKLKNQSINLGVAFAERARTAQLVGDSVLSIVDSARLFRKGKLKQAFRRIKQSPTRGKNLTQQWLALQYGWTPLLMDVHGACEALANRELLAFNVRVASRKKLDLSSTRTFVAGGLFNFSEITKAELSYHVALNYMPQESLIRSYTSLGLTNPAEIFWELVPFSFVADWFIPIGSWLSSLDAANGWTFSSGTVTKRSVCKRSTVHVPVTRTAFPYTTKGDCRFESEKKVVRRLIYANSPIPGRPSMKDPRSLKHMANAMALLVGFFSRGKLGGLSGLPH